MEDQAKFWEEISEALAWRMPKVDQTPIHRFNRLTKRQLLNIKPWLDQQSCTARGQHLTKEEIHNLQSWHENAEPARLGDKIVVFLHEGIMAIVDGGNRVNLYKKNNQQGDMPAIVVELRRTAKKTPT